MASQGGRITIADGVAEAVIRPDLGAGLESYGLVSRAGRQELFRRAPADAREPFQLGLNLLLPWSGRISGGGFWFGGRFHALSPNLAGEALPIHGNAFMAAWEVEAADPASARLRLRSDGPGPYRYDASVVYALDGGALTATLSATNRAAMALPYGLGLHPWFPRTRLTTLRFAARTVWFEDARHLPAGSADVAARPDWDFSAARALPEGWLHGWFSGWDGAATITWPERGMALEATADAGLGSCVLYSPGAASGFLCFEPVSHPVDAHNLADGAEAHGLVVLEKEEAVSASARFRPRVL